MIRFEYLAANVGCLYIQFYIVIIETLLGHFLYFVKSILPVLRLMCACLWHATHPVEFRTIKVISTLYLHTFCFDPFLPFFQIIAVISFILIQLPVIDLYNLGADTIQEIAVVRHHQQA